MNKYLSALLDIIYPRICPFCGNAVAVGKPRCDCDMTGVAVSDDINRKGIESEDHHLQYVFKAVSPIYYKGCGQHAVLKFKYGTRPGTGVYLADLMADCVRTHLPLDEIDFVTHVPAMKEDLEDKAYDQTAFLSRRLAKMLKKNSLDSLQKIYQTDKQHTLNKFRRAANVLGAYEVTDKEAVSGKIALLVDDILTTGYTADECAKMLRLRGCKKVYLCTAAFTHKEKEKLKRRM